MGKTDLLSGFTDVIKVETVKYLGVVIEDRFSWNSHVEELCGKLSTV